MTDFDLIIIGAGPGGYEMAAEAAFYREISGGTVPEDEEYSA